MFTTLFTVTEITIKVNVNWQVMNLGNFLHITYLLLASTETNSEQSGEFIHNETSF